MPCTSQCQSQINELIQLVKHIFVQEYLNDINLDDCLDHIIEEYESITSQRFLTTTRGVPKGFEFFMDQRLW
jgi:hypothetical protein